MQRSILILSYLIYKKRNEIPLKISFQIIIKQNSNEIIEKQEKLNLQLYNILIKNYCRHLMLLILEFVYSK